MGFNLPTANKGGNAPQVDDGLALLRFDNLALVVHEDWATEADKFGKPDDGSRFHFVFTLLDDSRAVVYKEDGDPIEVEAVTRTATGTKSNFQAILGGILTAQEMAAWQEATEDSPFDGSKLPGRIVHAKIAHNSKGWPLVESVVGIAKAK